MPDTNFTGDCDTLIFLCLTSRREVNILRLAYVVDEMTALKNNAHFLTSHVSPKTCKSRIPVLVP